MDTDSSRSSSERRLNAVEFDWRKRDQTAVECVIEAIAAETGIPATRQRPLYESIDPDALERILESGSVTPGRGPPLSVSFCHEDCAVRITADGELTVTHRTADR